MQERIIIMPYRYKRYELVMKSEKMQEMITIIPYRQ